jgi:hypothetical protein
MGDGTDAITGLIPVVLAVGIVKKTSDAKPFPKLTMPKGGLFKK